MDRALESECRPDVLVKHLVIGGDRLEIAAFALFKLRRASP